MLKRVVQGVVKVMQRFLSALSLTLLLTGFSAVAQVQQPFTDPIDRVVAAGLMSRSPDGDFRPNAIMSRAELASILVRAFRLDLRAPLLAEAAVLQDVPDTYWASDAIQVVVRTGVMQGYEMGRFFPDQRVNRAEAFSIFAQAYGVSQFPDETVDEILAPYPDAEQLPVWARRSVATAVYAGFVNVDAENQLNPLQPMTRADMAFALSRFLEQQQNPDGRL